MLILMSANPFAKEMTLEYSLFTSVIALSFANSAKNRKHALSHRIKQFLVGLVH